MQHVQFMRIFALAAYLAVPSLACAQGTTSGAATPAPAAAPTADPAILARAKSWFAQIQSGKVDRSQLTAEMNGLMTQDALAGISAQLSKLGPPVAFDQQRIVTQGDNTGYVYVLTFADGSKRLFVFAVNAAGQVSGLRISNPQ